MNSTDVDFLDLGGDLVMLVMTFVCEPEFFMSCRATHAMLAPWEQRYTLVKTHEFTDIKIHVRHIFGMPHSRVIPAVQYTRDQEWYLWGKLACRDHSTITHREWMLRDGFTCINGVYIKKMLGKSCVYENGNRTWYSNNFVQRVDGPACEHINTHVGIYASDHTHVIPWKPKNQVCLTRLVDCCGCTANVCWYRRDVLYRINGPAHVLADGSREWYQNNELHRLDGAARELADGTREWYVHDMRHCDDGPAVELADGTREWWMYNQLHRLDGPARELADGTREWYVRGNLIAIPE